jgi:uncharacterized ion transporter superfamily protein YfcC
MILIKQIHKRLLIILCLIISTTLLSNVAASESFQKKENIDKDIREINKNNENLQKNDFFTNQTYNVILKNQKYMENGQFKSQIFLNSDEKEVNNFDILMQSLKNYSKNLNGLIKNY